ncbi:MAG: helix-turn-helix domain-containing protein [Succinivibrio sp.]|nr:helix-turn-helix domain-containing protein [Succinivibrio sp.]
MPSFGEYLRQCRERHLSEGDKNYSLRKTAQRLGIEPSYLSKIERGDFQPPSEEVIVNMAHDLGEDPDVLLAMAGKLSTDLREIILKRPKLFAQLLRELKEQPDHAILRITREVQDGEW